jgi:hypothetical protein
MEYEERAMRQVMKLTDAVIVKSDCRNSMTDNRPMSEIAWSASATLVL